MAEGRRFDGRRVAVTGAAGFIGSAVCRRLAEEGADVVGIDVAADRAGRVEGVGARFARADVTDPQRLRAAVDGVELVVHTAAVVHEWGAMADLVRVNVGGTATVLEAAGEAGVERVVHLSSVVVYGYDDRHEQDESAFRRVYGIPYIDTKSASDRLACRRGAVVIRPGDVYGPHGSQWVLRPLEAARAGGLAVPGRGDGVMLAVYVDDVAEAALCGLERGQPGEAYTAWQGEPVSCEEHFRRLARMADAREPRRLPRPLLAVVGAAMEATARLRGRTPTITSRAVTFVDRRGSVSIAKARQELGWAPRVPYEEGMRRTEEWLRSEGLI